MARRLVIGTRRSRLALIQTRSVSEALSRAFPGLEIELREITTRGDRMKEAPLSGTGERGVFTREIERVLLAGDIDLAVHSLKDLPVAPPEGLVIAATPERADPHDALVCREAGGLSGLAEGAAVGTGSPRRAAQLLAVRPDLTIRPLRGNVETRLEKLHRRDYDAIVVAKAALDRLALTDNATETLDYATCLPAPGQGALAVEVREDDIDVTRCVREVNDTPTFVATSAERMLLEKLGGGCHLPVGALAECTGGGELVLRAAVAAPDGTCTARAGSRGKLENAPRVVDRCFRELISRGAANLIP